MSTKRTYFGTWPAAEFLVRPFPWASLPTNSYTYISHEPDDAVLERLRYSLRDHQTNEHKAYRAIVYQRKNRVEIFRQANAVPHRPPARRFKLNLSKLKVGERIFRRCKIEHVRQLFDEIEHDLKTIWGRRPGSEFSLSFVTTEHGVYITRAT